MWHHWFFLVSSGRSTGSPSGDSAGDSAGLLIIKGTAFIVRSSSLVTWLIGSPRLVGVDRPDRAEDSASSFRRASSSRSNLSTSSDIIGFPTEEYILATKDFN